MNRNDGAKEKQFLSYFTIFAKYGSQSTSIDSLKAVLETSEGKERIRIGLSDF